MCAFYGIQETRKSQSRMLMQMTSYTTKTNAFFGDGMSEPAGLRVHSIPVMFFENDYNNKKLRISSHVYVSLRQAP